MPELTEGNHWKRCDLYRKTVLGNGLRILTERMPHTRSVSVCIFLGVGSRYETARRAGVSHFVEHVIFRGTQKRPSSGDISRAIEGLGGILNGGTDRESTVYWCKVPSQHLEVALDVLSDILLHSRFDRGDVEKERQVITEEINMCFDNPSQRVGQLLDSVLWAGHPLGRDIAGTKESVAAIMRSDLLAHVRHYYVPVNTVIAVAGRIDHNQVIDSVNTLLGDWKEGKARIGFTGFGEKGGDRLALETRDIEQSHLCLAIPGLSRVDEDRYKLDILNIVLGEGMSSRLFTEVRDQMGLAYSIYSFTEHLADSGALTVYAGVEPARLEEAIGAVKQQLERFTSELITEKELAMAREMARGRMLLRLEDSRHVASWIGAQEVLTGRVLTVDQISRILNAITAEEVREVARKLIRGGQMRMAVVGPNTETAALAALIN